MNLLKKETIIKHGSRNEIDNAYVEFMKELEEKHNGNINVNPIKHLSNQVFENYENAMKYCNENYNKWHDKYTAMVGFRNNNETNYLLMFEHAN